MRLRIRGKVRSAPGSTGPVAVQVLTAKGGWKTRAQVKPGASGAVSVLLEDLAVEDVVPALRLVRDTETLDQVEKVVLRRDQVSLTLAARREPVDTAELSRALKQAEDRANSAEVNLAINQAELVLVADARDQGAIELDSCQAELNKVVKQRAELFTEVFDLREQLGTGPRDHVPIEQVVGTLAGQVDRAAVAMADAETGFALEGVKVKLAGLLDRTGTAIDLRAHDAIAMAGSQLEFTLESAPGDAVVNDGRVPNMIGLTPVAVRRLVQAVGLRLESSTSTVPADHRVAHGQSFLQSPTKGSIIAPGMTVHVVFAEKLKS